MTDGWTPGRRIAILAEAAIHLIAARLAVAFLPFSGLVQFAVRDIRGRPEVDVLAPSSRVRWAVTTASRTPAPWAVCLPQAIAAHWMLGRRGVPSVLCFGVKREDGDQLASHAWLKVGDKIVVGGETASEFAQVLEFPSRSRKPGV